MLRKKSIRDWGRTEVRVAAWPVVLAAVLTLAACSSQTVRCDVGEGSVMSHPASPAGSGIVSFRETGDAGFPLAMFHVNAEQGCSAVLVDRFEYAGGEPRIEDVTALPFLGHDHLFVIVSWPINHRGIGTYGTFYEIRAYTADSSGSLTAADVAQHIDVSGIDGTDAGEPSTFPTRNAAELRQLLEGVRP